MIVERNRPLNGWPTIDSARWGEPFDAFPVEAPFQVRPDLVKLAPADDFLRVDREWAPMLAAKLEIHRRQADDGNYAIASAGQGDPSRARLAAVVRAADRIAAAGGVRLDMVRAGDTIRLGAAGYLARIEDNRVTLEAMRNDAEAVVQVLAAGDAALRLLGALALTLQEDLVLMEQGADGTVRAALLQVSFPSAWDPAGKVGQDLFGLHAPVADNTQLQSAAARLASALVSKGPFVRWVWTVTADPRWRAWPPLRAPAAEPVDRQDLASALADPVTAPLFFRLERQVTMPLGQGYGLFLIRVQLRPLVEVLAQPGRRELLQASLRSMSDAMVRYKNLAAVRARLLAA